MRERGGGVEGTGHGAGLEGGEKEKGRGAGGMPWGERGWGEVRGTGQVKRARGGGGTGRTGGVGDWDK